MSVQEMPIYCGKRNVVQYKFRYNVDVLRARELLFISGCQICREIEEEHNSEFFVLSPLDFIKETVHPEGMSRKQEQKRKKESVSRFLQIINALLNEGGGIVCVHTSTPHLLGLFDEAVDEHLLSLIPDDTFFDDNFERHYRDTKHVIFRVRPRRRPFSTYDFNTKVSTDKGLVDPTHGQMRYFLKELSQTHPDQQGNEILGQNISLRFTEDSEVEVSIGNTDIVFQEDAGTQAKKLSLKSKGNQEQWTYEDILSCFEEKKRLQKYITAFSKRQTGGSIYWGV